MRQFTPIVVAALLTLQPSPVGAQASFEGDFKGPLYVEVSRKITQSVAMLGRTKESEIALRFVFRIQPLKAEGDTREFEVTILAAEDKEVVRDGDTEEGTFEGFAKQKFRMTAKPRNQGIVLKIDKKLVESAFGDEAKNGSEAEKKFAAEMAELVLRMLLVDAFMPVPEKPVAVGDKWHNKIEMVIQSLARLTIDRQYKYEGRREHEGRQVEAVTWKSDIVLKPRSGDTNPVIPFDVKTIKSLAEPTNEGTVLWDPAVKRPVRVEAKQTYDLEMVVGAPEKSFKGKGKGAETTVIRFFEKNPLRKGK